jgi:hypothetical protein
VFAGFLLVFWFDVFALLREGFAYVVSGGVLLIFGAGWPAGTGPAGFRCGGGQGGVWA